MNPCAMAGSMVWAAALLWSGLAGLLLLLVTLVDRRLTFQLRAVQTALHAADDPDPGPPDGRAPAASRAAVARLQQRIEGLEAASRNEHARRSHSVQTALRELLEWTEALTAHRNGGPAGERDA